MAPAAGAILRAHDPVEPGEEWVIYRDRDAVEPAFFELEMEQDSG